MEKRKNYKEILVGEKMNKSGQLTIFIIVALVIIVGGILIYFFFPQVGDVFTGGFNPTSELRNCIEDDLNEWIDVLSAQGGYMEPEGFIRYKGQNVKYLCYISEYHKPCLVQQPFVKNHFEKELNDLIKDKAEACVDELINNYEKRGYIISLNGNVNSSVEIIPKKMDIIIEAPMTATKNDVTQSFKKFKISKNSEMYKLLLLAQSIVDYESTYGDVETMMYTVYYPNLRMHKIKLDDGSTVYTLEDVVTKERFTFASRGLAWPAGYT